MVSCRDGAGGDPEGEVQVWHYNLDLDPEKEAALARILDPREQERAAGFRFAKHRRRFIVGRGTLRIILARYGGCEPQAVRFEYGEYGKPYVAWPRSLRDIRFSVSNSHALGAMAVTWHNELGIDLEQVRPDRDHERIATREFSAEERIWLHQLPEAKRLVGFFELWTCKEAYLKGKGLGLTVPLNCFAVSVDPDTSLRLVWSDIDRSDPQRWSLHRLAIEPRVVACLAVEGYCRAVRSVPWRVG